MVHVPDQVNATLTQAPENAGMVNFMVGKMKHEFYVHEAAPPMNKLIIAVITALGFGVCGIDRCFMGQVTLGALKAITLGGCGIWACIDYVVLTVNCLMFWPSVNAIGYQAVWEKGTITGAFWVTLIILCLKIVFGGHGNMNKEN